MVMIDGGAGGKIKDGAGDGDIDSGAGDKIKDGVGDGDDG